MGSIAEARIAVPRDVWFMKMLNTSMMRSEAAMQRIASIWNERPKMVTVAILKIWG